MATVENLAREPDSRRLRFVSDPASNAGLSRRQRQSRQAWLLLGVFSAVMILAGIYVVSPWHHRYFVPTHGFWKYREIVLAMNAYARDHQGAYPAGKSSTEIFQQLLDGQYVRDPSLFYIPCDGKTPPLPGRALQPANVSWDVTSGLDAASSDLLPLVFSTGFKVAYVPGGAAVALAKARPHFDVGSLTPLQWWNGDVLISPYPDGIAVMYKSNSFMSINLAVTKADPGGVIPHIVPPDFQPDGKTYRQLTPDGALAP